MKQGSVIDGVCIDYDECVLANGLGVVADTPDAASQKHKDLRKILSNGPVCIVVGDIAADLVKMWEALREEDGSVPEAVTGSSWEDSSGG